MQIAEDQIGSCIKMKFQEQHEAFKRLAIQQGLYRLEHLNEVLPFGYNVPESRMDRWFAKLLTIPAEFSSQRRYVNRFKIGADPEFIFTDPLHGVRIDAHHLRLAQGLAFGMDNNGRLTEIRPYPSRSALHVTASIWTTLKWLAILKSDAAVCHWQAGVFIAGDGLGGHVHFGRKRPNRNMEIAALDVVSDELCRLNIYQQREIARRRQGDQHNQHYGMPGDFRLQMHGYEYRTFPSWLDSPELTFLILTLSKLAVHSPQLFHAFGPLNDLGRLHQRLKNIFSYFKDVDDDARLALMMVVRKIPSHMGGDFKSRWGISSEIKESKIPIAFIPTSIKPANEDVEEMFQYLLNQKPLSDRIPTPTWAPLVPPPGYEMVINRTETRGAKGLGELLWDVVQYRADESYSFADWREGARHWIMIPESLAKKLPVDWKKNYGNLIKTYSGSSANCIYSNFKSRETKNFTECRRLLLETIFPFWKISDVRADSYSQWKSHIKPTPKKREFGTLNLFGNMHDIIHLR